MGAPTTPDKTIGLWVEHWNERKNAGNGPPSPKERSERFTRIMWAYICGGVTLLSFLIGFGASFIPRGFGVLGDTLAGPLLRGGERQHSAVTGAMALGGIMIWFTFNGPPIQRYITG